jgi:hypothetical protein
VKNISARYKQKRTKETNVVVHNRKIMIINTKRQYVKKIVKTSDTNSVNNVSM